jgi:hypothetical protein
MDELLARQAALQAEARRFLERHGVEEILRRLGRVRPLGSFVTGLMVWRDLDFCVELETDEVWPALLPLLERCDALEYAREPDRHYVVLRLDGWKLDLSLWTNGLPAGAAPYPTGLDDETRLLLLRLKQEWRDRHPGEDLIWSYEIYESVLKHGARTIEQIEQCIVAAQAPPRTRS